MEKNWTKVNAAWKGDMNFIVTNDSGGQVQMGTINEIPGVGPMQLLLAGLAGCTGMDIVSILKKKRVILDDFKVEVKALRAETYPMIWSDIHVMYLFWSNDIKTKDIEQAIQLSEEKYCSASIMLGKSARIQSSYQVLKPGALPE